MSENGPNYPRPKNPVMNRQAEETPKDRPETENETNVESDAEVNMAQHNGTLQDNSENKVFTSKL